MTEAQTKKAMKELMSEFWRIQDEMDNLKTQLWRALHRLSHEIEENYAPIGDDE